MQRRLGCYSSGASYIELIIVLPVLLLMMMGTIEVGRLLSQRPWTSTVSYEAALTGAENNSDVGVQAMEDQFDRLMDIHLSGGNMRLVTEENVTPAALDSSTQYNSQDRTVTSSTYADVATIFDYLPGRLTTRYEAALLLKSPDMQAGDLSNFADGRCMYDCDGNEHCGVWSPSLNPCNGTYEPPPPAATLIPSQGCFAGETAVTMADGSQKSIKKIRSGDAVMAFDIQTGKRIPSRVLSTTRTVVDRYLLINGSLRVTARHRFYLSGRWVQASRLVPGDHLLTLLGSRLDVVSIETINTPLVVYNFSVERYRNYFAGGILVHNEKPDEEFGGPVGDGGMGFPP